MPGEIAFTLTTVDASTGPCHPRVTIDPLERLAVEIETAEPPHPKVGFLE